MRVQALDTIDDIKRAEKLLLKHGGEIYSQIWVFGVNTGLRISDILKLKFCDIDVETGKVHIKEKKTGKHKTVTLNSRALEVVNGRRSSRNDDEWLFQVHSNRAKGRAISRNSVYRKYREVGDILGVSMGTHSARKSRGAHLYQSGVALETITKLLNHSSTKTTLEYIGITEEAVQRTYTDYVI